MRKGVVITTAGGRLMAGSRNYPRAVNSRAAMEAPARLWTDHQERNRTMHPNTSDRQYPIPCPQWCHPQHHHEGADEVLHCSAATVLMVGDERWEFDLIQHVERLFPNEPGSVDLRIQVVDTVFSGCDGEHIWSVEAIPALAARLMTEYHRARFLGALAPVEPLVAGDAA